MQTGLCCSLGESIQWVPTAFRRKPQILHLVHRISPHMPPFWSAYLCCWFTLLAHLSIPPKGQAHLAQTSAVPSLCLKEANLCRIEWGVTSLEKSSLMPGFNQSSCYNLPHFFFIVLIAVCYSFFLWVIICLMSLPPLTHEFHKGEDSAMFNVLNP